MSAAQALLTRLLARAESARLRGSETPASMSMRDGALQVEREQHRGDGERLCRITVANLDGWRVISAKRCWLHA